MHLYQAIAATFLLFQPQAPQAQATRVLRTHKRVWVALQATVETLYEK